MRYDAFISYSHAADVQLAPSLQSALHSLAKPWFKIRALSVFRDQTDLTVSPGTWPSIERALADSRYFILLASPEAAASKWVQREVDFWLSQRDLGSLIIVITKGDVHWNGEGGAFDPRRTTALPDVLLSAYDEEPLYVDLRYVRNEVDLSLANPEYKQRLVPIAAKLHGRTPADLVSDEAREHKRTVRIRNTVIVALTLLTLSAGAAAWVAVDRAEEARNEAEAADRERQAAVQARKAAERELLRAQGAELRAMIQRLDVLAAQPVAKSDARRQDKLRLERKQIEQELKTVTAQHQKKLGEAIGFRGDFGFLARFEGHVRSVRFFGMGVHIAPATDLALAKPDVIRSRYAFILTPDELEAVLGVVGLRGDEAEKALENSPALQRIHLEEFDVARLVPEVAQPFWESLVKSQPILKDVATHAGVQTAVLSLAFNMGPRRALNAVEAPLSERNWLGVADAIEAVATERTHVQFPGLAKRRREEAGLIRSAMKQEKGL